MGWNAMEWTFNSVERSIGGSDDGGKEAYLMAGVYMCTRSAYMNGFINS